MFRDKFLKQYLSLSLHPTTHEFIMHYHQRILSLVLILATNISAYTVHNNRENLSKTRDGGFFSDRRMALAQIAALSSTLIINPVSYTHIYATLY